MIPNSLARAFALAVASCALAIAPDASSAEGNLAGFTLPNVFSKNDGYADRNIFCPHCGDAVGVIPAGQLLHVHLRGSGTCELLVQTTAHSLRSGNVPAGGTDWSGGFVGLDRIRVNPPAMYVSSFVLPGSLSPYARHMRTKVTPVDPKHCSGAGFEFEYAVAETGAYGSAYLMGTGQGSEAIRIAEDAVASARALGYRPLEAEAFETLGRLLDAKQDGARAVDVLEQAVLAAVAGRHEAVEVQASITLVHAAAVAPKDSRDFVQRARAALERDPDPDRLATLTANEGFAAAEEHRLENAREVLDRALAMREKLSPDTDPEIGRILMFIANVGVEQGRLDDALAAGRRAVALRERAFGATHPSVASALIPLGNALMLKGDSLASEQAFQRALDVKIAAFGVDNRGVADAMEGLGNAQHHAGKPEVALETQRRAQAIRERILPPDDEDIARSLVNVGETLLALKRWDEALPAAQRALAILERSQPGRWVVAFPLSEIGAALVGLGKPGDALAYLERAAKLTESADADPGLGADVRAMLALALHAAHREPARALALAARAREVYATMPAQNLVVAKLLDEAIPRPRGP